MREVRRRTQGEVCAMLNGMEGDHLPRFSIRLSYALDGEVSVDLATAEFKRKSAAEAEGKDGNGGLGLGFDLERFSPKTVSIPGTERTQIKATYKSFCSGAASVIGLESSGGSDTQVLFNILTRAGASAQAVRDECVSYFGKTALGKVDGLSELAHALQGLEDKWGTRGRVPRSEPPRFHAGCEAGRGRVWSRGVRIRCAVGVGTLCHCQRGSWGRGQAKCGVGIDGETSTQQCLRARARLRI